jgi:outer membrane beta-barrel protein
MTKRLILAFLFAAVAGAPLAAHAQRRSPLEDAPAVRHRIELRTTRFELGAGAGTTVNQTFNHGILANVRLAFHLTDWLAISGTGAFNAVSIPTGFTSELKTAIPAMPMDPLPRDPTQAEVLSAVNKMSTIIGLQGELTPFSGKFSLFGKLFAHYDLYAFGGVGIVNLTRANSNTAGVSECVEHAPRDANGRPTVDSCLLSGMKVGATYGFGLHAYFNDFIGLNTELRDLRFSDNPAGRDVNGDQGADKQDAEFSSHLVFLFGVTVFLPAKAAISD